MLCFRRGLNALETCGSLTSCRAKNISSASSSDCFHQEQEKVEEWKEKLVRSGYAALHLDIVSIIYVRRALENLLLSQTGHHFELSGTAERAPTNK